MWTCLVIPELSAVWSPLEYLGSNSFRGFTLPPPFVPGSTELDRDEDEAPVGGADDSMARRCAGESVMAGDGDGDALRLRFVTIGASAGPEAGVAD